MDLRRLATCLALIVLVAGCGGGDDAEEIGDGATTSSAEEMPQESMAPPTEETTTVAAGTSTGSVDVGGVARTYRLHVPEGLRSDEPVPLLVALHGGGGSGEQYSRSSQWDSVADAEGFVVVYPDGTGGIPTWNAGECCGAAARDDTDDVGLVDALIDHLAATLPIDEERVVATGHSNGSTMSYRLACELADRIVAIGVQAAPLTYDGCAPSEPVSVLHIHGAEDPNVPIGGGQGSTGLSQLDWPSVREGVDTMAVAAGCDGDPATSTAGILSTTMWSGCDDGTEVELVVVAGGGHGWMRPGGTGQRGGAEEVGDFDSTATIWDFLSRQLD
jgi:polyhydroxybutyrate depolymerase